MSHMTNDEKENTIRAYIASYNRFDVEGMAVFLDPEVIFRNISGNEVNAETRGIDDFVQLVRDLTLLEQKREPYIYMTWKRKSWSFVSFMAVGVVN